MVRCRECGAWFCSEHIAAEEVTLVRPAHRALSGAKKERTRNLVNGDALGDGVGLILVWPVHQARMREFTHSLHEQQGGQDDAHPDARADRQVDELPDPAVLAIFDESYAEHAAIAVALENTEDLLVVSPMVVAEAEYMLASRLGPKAARRFAADIASEAYDLAEWTSSDHAAALAVIGRQGDDSDYLGIADASNVILADRHRTTTILTLDQRHFRRLRPLWGATHFTLLPYDT